MFARQRQKRRRRPNIKSALVWRIVIAVISPVHPLTAEHVYGRLQPVCFSFKIRKNEIFTHLELWVALARHNSKWVNIWHSTNTGRSPNVGTVLGRLSNVTNMCNFHPMEVVGCASETQLEVGAHLDYLF